LYIVVVLTTQAYLILLPTHVWHLHVVCWRADIFIFLTSKDVKTDQMNLHKRRPLNICTVRHSPFWWRHMICYQ